MHIKTIDSLCFPHGEVLQAVFALVPHRLTRSFTGDTDDTKRLTFVFCENLR